MLLAPTHLSLSSLQQLCKEGLTPALSSELIQTHRMSGFTERTQLLSNWPPPRRVAVAITRIAEMLVVWSASPFQVGSLTKKM